MSAGTASPSAPWRTADPRATSSRRAYRALAVAAFRSLMAYRLQFTLGLLGSVFTLLSMLYLWRTILKGGHAPAGFGWPQMKAYLLVAFLANAVVSAYTDYRMASRIRDGLVAVDLTKPVDYQRARFAEALGYAVFEVAVGLGVVAAAVAVFGAVPLPPAPMLALFLISAVLVVPLKFSLVYISALACFWTQNYMGVHWARLALMQLFSGAMVPLALFPDWLRWIAEALPFQGMVYTPALIFIDRLHGPELWLRLAVQAGWAIALWYGAQLAWDSALRRLTVHGG
ncbi:MAG: ABC-2 family transporter protein [Actinomycetota bacterium]|nr:ABC-2 family transporter protein [Actinomycetota bacterium]